MWLYLREFSIKEFTAQKTSSQSDSASKVGQRTQEVLFINHIFHDVMNPRSQTVRQFLNSAREHQRGTDDKESAKIVDVIKCFYNSNERNSIK